MNISKMIVIVVIASTIFMGCANDRTRSENIVLSDNLNYLITQYMARVFGENTPTLKDYYVYEGWHSEIEYDMEISVCKTRFGNLQNLNNKQYAKLMPKECRDWISDRHDNPDKNNSLFYESIRKKYQKYPLRYIIKSTEQKDDVYLVSLMLLEEKTEIKLNVYRSITDPELMIVEINKVIQ